MHATIPGPLRTQQPMSRLFRRVRWILLFLDFLGFLIVFVWLNTLSVSQFGQEESVIVGAFAALGGLLMVVAGFSLIGRWKPGRRLEFWMRKLPWLLLFFGGLEPVLPGIFLVTRPDPSIALFWGLLPAGGTFLIISADTLVFIIFMKRKKRQRASQLAFLTERAQHRLDAGINLEPEEAGDDATAASAWVSQGQHWLKEQNYIEALRAFDWAISLDAGSAQAYLGQGMALSRLEARTEALMVYEQAWELDHTLVEALAGQALMHTALGRPEEGLALAQEALRLDPARSLTYVTQGTALLRLRSYGAAFQSYWKAWRVARNTARARAGSAA